MNLFELEYICTIKAPSQYSNSSIGGAKLNTFKPRADVNNPEKALVTLL